MVLHQIALDVQDVIALKQVGRDVLCCQFPGYAKVCGKGAFGIGADEGVCYTRCPALPYQPGFDAHGATILREEVPHVVVAHATHESRVCPQIGQSQHGVACAASRGSCRMPLLQLLSQPQLLFPVDELHAALGKA